MLGPLRHRLLRTALVTLEGGQPHIASELDKLFGETFGRHGLKGRPILRVRRHIQPLAHDAGLVGQVEARDLLVHLLGTERRTQRILGGREQVIRDERDSEAEQRSARVPHRVQFAVEHLRQLEKHRLQRPPPPVQVCNRDRAGIAGRHVRQDGQLRVPISCRGVQAHEDPAGLERGAILAFEGDLLLKDFPGFGAPAPTERARRDDAQLGMMANDEEALSCREPVQERKRAEVAVRHPAVAGLRKREHLRRHGALLRVPVFTRQHVGREHEVGLENDERLSRQRARRAFPEHVEPSLRRGEMVAIEDAYTVAREPRRKARGHGNDHRPQAGGRVRNEGCRDRDLGTIDLVVD